MISAEVSLLEIASTNFRQCATKDLPFVEQMVSELYATDIGESDTSTPNIRLTFDTLSKRPDCGDIIVFEWNNELVGYAIVIFVWSNEFNGFFLDVDEVYVRQIARGKGVGKSFFQWLETAFDKRGVVAFSLQVSPSNLDALRLYESIGFRRSSSTFLKKMR